MMKRMHCDILIVGGSTGGTAAALRATAMGRRVIVTEPTRWLGGQLTAQGVSALDEHAYIEEFGGTAGYYEFRNQVREYYRTHHHPRTDSPRLNPGNAWVSRLCYEPKVGVAVLAAMLKPALDAGLLTVLYETEPIAVERTGALIRSVTVAHLATQQQTQIAAQIVIDASELGDLLPLADLPYRTGMESFPQSRDASAPADRNPVAVQSFTYPFVVEHRPGERHVIPRPEGYERFRDTQPYSLDGYKMFAAEGLPFWTYRRLVDASQFDDPALPHDLAMINWPSNDYHFANIIDEPRAERERILEEAKRLSLGFLYWLQTEAPRDEGGFGYPELKLRPDVMGTADGLSMFPYIRESRRLQAYQTIREQDIVVTYNHASRSRIYPDTVGIGLYIFVDVHRCANTDATPGAGQKMRPYHIPVGAMLSPAVCNLIAGAKNLGVTHIANGAYRLHPTEWNVGESAGALAAFALDAGATPDAVYQDKALLRQYQGALVAHGISLYWFTDVPHTHPAFAAVQYLAATGVIAGDAGDLLFRPDEPVSAVVADEWVRRAEVELAPEPSETRAAFARSGCGRVGVMRYCLSFIRRRKYRTIAEISKQEPPAERMRQNHYLR